MTKNVGLMKWHNYPRGATLPLVGSTSRWGGGGGAGPHFMYYNVLIERGGPFCGEPSTRSQYVLDTGDGQRWMVCVEAASAGNIISIGDFQTPGG